MLLRQTISSSLHSSSLSLAESLRTPYYISEAQHTRSTGVILFSELCAHVSHQEHSLNTHLGETNCHQCLSEREYVVCASLSIVCGELVPPICSSRVSLKCTTTPVSETDNLPRSDTSVPPMPHMQCLPTTGISSLCSPITPCAALVQQTPPPDQMGPECWTVVPGMHPVDTVQTLPLHLQPTTGMTGVCLEECCW